MSKTFLTFDKSNKFDTPYLRAGLFTYQSWNGMDGFWQNGIALETMANTMHYGNHSRYFSVVKVTKHAYVHFA